MTDEAANESMLLIRVFRGQARLWVAFWMVGVLGQIALWVAIVLLAFLAGQDSIGMGSLLVMLAGVPVAALMWLYCMIGIWRCAPNVKDSTWRGAARFFVVLMLLGPIAMFGIISYTQRDAGCREHIPNDCPKR